MKCKKCPSYALNISPKSGLCDVCYYKTKLFNLLARIHRDGGHYTEEHGVVKSCKDANKIVADAIVS